MFLAESYVLKLQLLHYTHKNETQRFVFPQDDIVTSIYFQKDAKCNVLQ